MTEINWNKLTSVEQLKQLDEISKSQPVLIFKHSTSCSISAASLNRLERKWNPEKVPQLKAYFLDLLANRSVSNAIAAHYGVEHQSPQVLMIQNERCVYDNSHFGISFDEIVDQIQPISA